MADESSPTNRLNIGDALHGHIIGRRVRVAEAIPVAADRYGTTGLHAGQIGIITSARVLNDVTGIRALIDLSLGMSEHATVDADKLEFV